MSYTSYIQTGGNLGLPIENVDVFVWNRNPAPSATSSVILPGEVVPLCIADFADIQTGYGLTAAIGHSRYANIFGNVTKDYAAGARKYAICGVALERIECSTSTTGHRGGRIRLRGVVQAHCRTGTSTAWSPGYAGVIDDTNKGFLDFATSLSSDATSATTAKIIALALEAGTSALFVTTPASTTLKWVMFDGLNGFGGHAGEFNQ